MKKTSLLIVILCCLTPLAAQIPPDSIPPRQDSIQKTAAIREIDRHETLTEKNIAITPVIPQNILLPEAAKNNLQNKMRQILSFNNLAASSQRFIMRPEVSLITRELAKTTPPKYALKLELSFYVEDTKTQKIVGQHTTTLKGVGDTEEKAYLNAIGQINTRSPQFKKMMTNCKNKILNNNNR